MVYLSLKLFAIHRNLSYFVYTLDYLKLYKLNNKMWTNMSVFFTIIVNVLNLKDRF